MQALLGDDPSLAPLKQLLIARTEGNPFFLEESVRDPGGDRGAGGRAGAYRLAQALPTIQVPATVQAVLAARIDRLPPEDKRLLQTAAVIGTEVPFALLQAIAEVPEEALHRGLAHLQAAEFLYETRLFPEREYTFKHALTHEVAYSSLLQERRRALHARIVGALEALTPSAWPSRSNAWRTTPCGARCGTRRWPTAGRLVPRRMARAAHREAVASFEQALVALGHLPESRDTHVSRLSISGSTCALAGASGRIRAALHPPARGRNPRRGAGGPRRLGGSCYMGWYFRVMGDYDRTIASGQRALAIAEALVMSPLQVMAIISWACLPRPGDYRRAIELARQNVAFLARRAAP